MNIVYDFFGNSLEVNWWNFYAFYVILSKRTKRRCEHSVLGWIDAPLTHGDGSGSGPLVFLMWPGILNFESLEKCDQKLGRAFWILNKCD